MSKYREKVHSKFGGRCAYCGERIKIKDMQIDHIFPKIHGGKDEEENLNPACRVCNNFKSVFTIDIFRDRIENQIAVARANSSPFRRAERYNLIEVTNKKVVFYFEKVNSDNFTERGCGSGWYDCNLCSFENSSGLGGWTLGKHPCGKCKGEGVQP